MANMEFAGIVAAFMQQFCGIPGVIDVSAGNRFGEDVVTVTVPTEDERETLSSSLPDSYEGVRVYIVPMFGIGSFTKESSDTKRFESLMYTPPYNVYGTPENRELDALAEKILDQEREAWVSMSDEARENAIEEEVSKRRESGWRQFGNCRLK